MKTIASYKGGSISYGLSTPASDIDIRGVFLNTEISKIIGLERYEHESTQNSTEDSFHYELRNFINLLRRGNTMCIEMLFNDIWEIITPEFIHIQQFKNDLIDTDKLYKTLRGYCQSERGLVLGSRQGVLGGKRRAHLDTYGYSYKNAVQFLRLCRAGAVLFKTGIFPVNIRPYDTADLILNVKTHPENFTKESIVPLMDRYEKDLNDAYENREFRSVFNNDIANQLCYDMYFPILEDLK